MYTQDVNCELTDLIRQGDIAGHQLLYKKYASIVYGVINRIVKNVNTTEDLLERVFCNICQNIAEFQPDKISFGSWIIQKARSISIDHLSKLNLVLTEPLLEKPQEELELLIIPLNIDKSSNPGLIEMVLQGQSVASIAQKLGITIEEVKLNIRKVLKFSC